MNSIQAFRQDFECPICWEDVHEGKGHSINERISHIFCESCLTRWLKERAECPFCQKPLQERSVSFFIPILEMTDINEIPLGREGRRSPGLDNSIYKTVVGVALIALGSYCFFL